MVSSKAIASAVMAAVTCLPLLCAADVPPPEASAIVVSQANVNRAVASIDRLTHDLMRKTGVPGIAIAVVHDDKVVFLKGFGVRKTGMNERVDANTIFELASVSKPIGAAVIAGIVGRGGVNWNDPIRKYLPGFTLSDPYVTRTVTIADMYAHRSGLPDHAGDLLEDLGYGRGAILNRLSLEPLKRFRITYEYTNFGITAAAQAVASAQKTSWEQLSHDVLYAPLGMTSTSSRYSDYAKASNRAWLHVRIGSRWFAKYTRNADAQSPAGGVSSSARDMAQWLRFELANGKYDGKQVVDEKALLETRLPNLMSSPLASPNSRASFYGFGINVGYDEGGRLRLSHSGGFASGAATTVVLLPSAGLGIVVLTNGMPIGIPEAIAAEFMDIAEFGSVRRDWFAGYSRLMAPMYHNPSVLANKTPPKNAGSALPNTVYAGTYANRYYGPAMVVFKNGALVMELGPHRKAFILRHWDGNTYSYQPQGENAVGISAVTFTVPSGSKYASKVTIENLNENRLGTFLRS
jgi:CubicO group peptidase (beta-lactamase class C family)